MRDQFIISVALKREGLPRRAAYPLDIPAIRRLGTLEFAPAVTIFVGENGSGKSTLLEAIAVAVGLNAEGGSRNFNFDTRASHSTLHSHLRVTRGVRRPGDSYFLRAESFYNVATQVDELGVAHAYGGKSLHEQSHGESFFALMRHRFREGGLYLMDEPEAALSPTRQLSSLRLMADGARSGSQFILATHSPILMGYPGAWIYQFSGEGIRRIDYEQTEHYQVTRDFLTRRAAMLKELLSDEEA